MISKEYCVEKYKEYKEKFKKTPKTREFCKFAGFDDRKLIQLFGPGAFSKLQADAGDNVSKITMVRMPLETIMRQYGDLVLEVGKPPSSSEWIHRGLKPGVTGLERAPHFIKWSEFPSKFKSWVELEGIEEYQQAIETIEPSASKANSKREKVDREFEKLIFEIRSWSPARRRNNEEGYKVELRGHLQSVGYEVGEEFGESNFDLLVNKKFAVELKKDPNQSEYDRLFGQLARHLQHQIHVVALILDVPSEDKLKQFCLIVDEFLNRNKKFIEVIKK